MNAWIGKTNHLVGIKPNSHEIYVFEVRSALIESDDKDMIGCRKRISCDGRVWPAQQLSYTGGVCGDEGGLIPLHARLAHDGKSLPTDGRFAYVR